MYPTVPVLAPERLAWFEGLVESNLKDTVALRSGVKTFEAGGTGSKIVWSTDDPTWTEPANVSPASAPQEQLTAGSITEVRTFWVTTRAGVLVPSNTDTAYYRLEWAHDIAGLTNPFPLYLTGTPFRSYRVLSKFLCTTVAPK